MNVDPQAGPSDHPDRPGRSGHPVLPDRGERRDRQLLDDCGAVLHARTELDELALQVLSSTGLAEPEVGKLRQFLTSEWQPAVLAYRRLQAVEAGQL